MQEKYYKYAKLLLTKGLCINENQPLVINAPITTIDFIRVLTTIACQLGVKDIYYDWYDDELKHTQLKYYDEKDVNKIISNYIKWSNGNNNIDWMWIEIRRFCKKRSKCNLHLKISI